MFENGYEDTGIVWGIYPYCWKLGENPEFMISGTIPVYNKLNSEQIVTSYLSTTNDETGYKTIGAIDIGESRFANDKLILNNFNFSLSNSSEFNIAAWLKVSQFVNMGDLDEQTLFGICDTDDLSDNYLRCYIKKSNFYALQLDVKINGQIRQLQTQNYLVSSMSPESNFIFLEIIKKSEKFSIRVNSQECSYNLREDYDLGDYNFNTKFIIGNSGELLTYRPLIHNEFIYSIEYRNFALNENDSIKLKKLGCYLGGKKGYLLNDGSMSLENINKSFTTLSNIDFGVFPSMLYRGTNPLDFTGVFPTYSPNKNIKSTLENNAKYCQGKIELSAVNQQTITTNYNFSINDINDLTFDVVLEKMNIGTHVLFSGQNEGYNFFIYININENKLSDIYFSIFDSSFINTEIMEISFQGSYFSCLNEKTNLVFVKKGSSIKIYQNGIRTQSLSIYNNSINTNEMALKFGLFYHPNLHLHRMTIFNRELTSEEILSNYLNGDNFGGVYGYDEGNGSMLLLLPQNRFKKNFSTSVNDLNYFYGYLNWR